MLLLSLILLIPPLPIQQQEKPLVDCKIGAQQLPDGRIRCNEGAVVTYQDVRVQADWLEFNPETQDVTAGEKVHLSRGTEEVSGGRIIFNLKTKTGTFADASGLLEGWHLKALEYERLPDGRVKLKRPSATACASDCPKWHWTASESTVTPGERFSAKNLVFKFWKVPVLYFPRFSVPTEKKERQSGFLIPVTGTSTSKGRSFQESFYWAINRSYDATFTGEYFSLRGPAGKVDFRGAPSPTTRFDVSTLFASDRLGHGGYRSNLRMFSGYKDWRTVAVVDVTSNFDFRQSYEETVNSISNPIELSTVFATRNKANSSWNVLFNRTGVFFPGAPSTVLRKLPAIELQLPTNQFHSRLPIYFSFDGGVGGMSRRDININTPAFVERTDLHPTIQIPLLKSSLLSWSHQFGLRETFYTHSLDNGAVHSQVLNRGAFDYTMKLTGPQIEKVYGTWKHVVEPTLEYRYVAGVDEFRKTIVVDENDLVTDTNEIEYGITNRFLGRWEFLTWRVAQKLYFDPTFGNALVPNRRNTLEPLMDLTGFAFSSGTPRRFSPIVSTVRIATTPNASTDIEVDYDTERHEFSSAGVMGGLGRGLFASSVGYFFNKRTEIQPPSNQLSGLLTYGNSTRRGINAGFGFYYDILNRIFRGSTSQVSYNAECYGLSFEFTQYNLGPRIESRLRFSLTLKNLGSIGTLRPQERLF